MTSPMSARTKTPWWRTSRAVLTAALAFLVVLMFVDTTFDSGDGDVPADTAVEYAKLNYEEFIVPGLVERARPVQELVADILADPQAAGEEFGRREDDGKPFSYAVAATGVVTEGPFGEVGLDVDGMPGGITVGVSIPPLGSAPGLRDAGTELTFGDFVNQTEYQRVAVEINNLAAEGVFADLDLTTMMGEQITVVGAFTWSSETGGEVTHVSIMPVSIEEGS
ncbi:DUF2291 family protein [Demequina sp.]|uniref:DUF2291 family protein n=1 Tax=Demequina sp. TaxID=2050685 RepID=UPI0025C09812|nr:DUF2291 family protein [Demequina sp.]